MEQLESQPELELDSEFDVFFRSLSEKAGLVRIFDRNGFFSIHGNDARAAANDMYKTQAALKMSSGLPSLTITRAGFGKFLKQCLFQRSLKVEIWQHQRSTGWQLVKEASPGNIQAIQELLSAEDIDGSVLLAIQMQKSTEGLRLGACFSDIERHKIGLLEFLETDTFSNFESLIIQLGIRECLLKDDPNNEVESNKLKAVLERCNITCTVLQARDFTNKSIESDFSRLLLDRQQVPSSAKETIALSAASALCSYLALFADPANFDRFEYWTFDLSMFMKLDGSALKALSLMPSVNDGANKSMNLFGLLNQCRTAIGSRLLGQWLKQPLLNVQEIEKRHDILSYFYDHNETREALQSELKLIPDLARLSNKFRKGQAQLEDVVRAYQVTTRIPEIENAFGTDADYADSACIHETYLEPLKEYRQSLEKFQDLVETTVDLQALEHHEYLIRPDFDASLGNLKAKIEETREAVNMEHDRVADDISMEKEKKLKLEQHSIYGYCLRLSRVEAAAIRQKRDYKELQTAKAGVFFTTTTLMGLAKAYTDLSSQYSRHQTGLVREVVTIAASYCPVFESLGNVIAHLDVMLAFAKVSLLAPTAYVRPRINPMGTGSTILTGSRHPCIEVQDDVSFIPNDISLVRGQSEFLIITGANMGGKSTYIRQVGMITLMAQIGCYVPCDDAEVTVVDSILARVGAGDSQLKGISTFMSECLETGAILRQATANSLIIIDELGRGTSTTDGYGLAFAISEHIVQKIGCFSLFATHFHELTALSESQPTVKNLHVSTHIASDTEGITLLYKVVEGSCNQSFGIHVAELARFPASVVAMSKRKLEELEQSTTEPEQDQRRTRSKLDYASVSKILGRLSASASPTLAELRRVAAEVMAE